MHGDGVAGLSKQNYLLHHGLEGFLLYSYSISQFNYLEFIVFIFVKQVDFNLLILYYI